MCELLLKIVVGAEGQLFPPVACVCFTDQPKHPFFAQIWPKFSYSISGLENAMDLKFEPVKGNDDRNRWSRSIAGENFK